jgi:hypothetical protein
MQNLLFSTTKQWNPGDELILKGVRNLLPPHVFLMFNRHPHINFNNRNGDNSYYFGMGDEIVEHIIFSGSPEYYTEPNRDMYKLIFSKKTPFSYIGVGGPPLSRHIPFEKAKVKIVRDSAAAKIPGSTLLPCPSMFSYKNTKIKAKTEKKDIAFCYQSGLSYICSPEQTINDLSVKFIKEFEPIVVCHSYVDYVDAINKKLKNVFYSAEFSDFENVYKNVDMIVGTRIHGCGWGTSFGVPGILLAHDNRWETARNFGMKIHQGSYEDLKKTFLDFDVESNSHKIIELRKETFTKYSKLLNPVFGEPTGWEW